MSNSSSTGARASIDGVLVVGGGYAGLHAARAVAKAGVGVAIVDRAGTHDFITRLAGIAAGSLSTDEAACDLRDLHDDIRIGTVERVFDGAVELGDGSRLEADAVIVSAGAKPTSPPIPGIEHALTLRTAGDAVQIRTRLASADSVIIVGGGATGVQLAGEIAATVPEVPVTVVEAADRLLLPMKGRTADGAARILRDRGVDLLFGSPVDEIREDGVLIGGEHRSGLVVWAGGFEAGAEHLGVDVDDDGRILVDDDLRVVGMSRTFAAGDIAAHLDDQHQPLPMSAQIAVQAGTAAGDNAVRVLRGDDTEAADLAQRGWVLDLGGGRGVAEFGPIALSGPIEDLLPPFLHTLIDLKTLFGIGGFSALRL